MDLLVFCTAFILQFVGHRVGDYLLQTHTQSLNKSKGGIFLYKHSIVYSTAVASFVMVMDLNLTLFAIVYALTYIEHIIVDRRTPVVWWKNFLEHRLARNKDFNTDELPFFVIIEIDQTIHYLRIFIISVLVGYGVHL